MDVSVIIVNYNTLELSNKCISSIIEHTSGIEYEIILVDNASTDGSGEAFARDSRIRFIEAGGNLGFGKANNLGLQSAKGDFIFFLNSDTVLKDNVIYKLWDFTRFRFDVGGVGTLLLGPDGRRTHSFGFFLSPSRMIGLMVHNLLTHLTGRPIRTVERDCGIKVTTPMKVDYVTGADLFVARRVLDRAGAFDPDFFLYCEETEMQMRWHRAGYDNYVLPIEDIIHYEGASSLGKNSVKKRKTVADSYLLYYRKTETLPVFILFAVAFFIVNLPLYFKAWIIKLTGKSSIFD